ncbi:hypothetical protein FOTG_18275 [Fusarium oxysporum f. sp. vasinfectum 25433]|uniref:Uncharacterized protein n=1 Tax=Fusarium oxysporum f. sp. vasinfectum 25433 TaxID=1089449 RepID=X0KID8_FUSOX|nr:hypothetical protein FOTG_18275 [Fusarium oxysporum f. sp. vasinfectum 25433]
MIVMVLQGRRRQAYRKTLKIRKLEELWDTIK